jgi:hypothetical protein
MRFECNSLTNCCGVLEVGFFPIDSTPSEEAIKKEFRNRIAEYCEDESGWDDVESTIDFLIATTNKYQMYMHPILKGFGFRSRKFKDRFGKDDLYFWSRRGLPREIKSLYKKMLKENHE